MEGTAAGSSSLKGKVDELQQKPTPPEQLSSTSPKAPTRKKMSSSLAAQPAVGAKQAVSQRNDTWSKINLVMMEFKNIQSKGYESSANAMLEDGGKKDPSYLTEKVMGGDEEATHVTKEGREAATVKFCNAIEAKCVAENETGVWSSLARLNSPDAPKEKATLPQCYTGFTLEPAKCLEAGEAIVSSLDAVEGKLALEYGDSRNPNIIHGGFMQGHVKYDNTRADLFSPSDQNNSTFYIGPTLINAFIKALPPVHTLTGMVFDALVAKGFKPHYPLSKGTSGDSSIVLAGMNVLFHGASLCSQWNWHQDTHEFEPSFISFLAVIVQLSGGVSEVEIMDLSSETKTATLKYNGPGAAMAVASDLFHRTASAEIRTVKLAYFFKLPPGAPKIDLTNEEEDVELVDGLEIKSLEVKMESEESEQKPEEPEHEEKSLEAKDSPLKTRKSPAKSTAQPEVKVKQEKVEKSPDVGSSSTDLPVAKSPTAAAKGSVKPAKPAAKRKHGSK